VRTLSRNLKNNDPDDLAAMTLWLEARGDEPAGQLAIGRVIRNRMGSRQQSDGTVIGTVLKKHQFSGWNPGTMPNKHHDPRIIANFNAALRVDLDSEEVNMLRDVWRASEKIPRSRFPATMYHTTRTGFPKGWNRDAIEQELGEIGEHTFYKEKFWK